MFGKKRSPKASLVGLELDPAYVAAAQVGEDGGLTLMRGAVAELPPGVMRDGEVADAEALADALRDLFTQHELPRRVRLGIAHQRIVVRALDLPLVAEDPKRLAAAVRDEAPDHIPMPMDQAVLDFQPIGVVQSPTGPRTRVVVVAVRREMVERVALAAQAAGLTIEGIDLSAFGLVRAIAEPEPGAVLYLNVAGLTNVAVARPEGCLFTRAAGGGLEAIVAALIERAALTREHAHQWIAHVGLAAPLEGVEGDPDLVAATRLALEEGVDQLADAVRTSLNFYRTQEGSDAVDRGVVSGPAIAIPGFVDRLSEQLRLPLEGRAIETGDGAREALDVGRLTVAAGLAVAARP